MRGISAENYAALQARRLVARDFLWLTVRTLDTGLSYSYGFWSDVGNIAVPVLNPNTGIAETRNFEGSGTLIQISDIPLVSNLSVQNTTISASQISEGVANIVRGYDMKQAGVEVYRGLFDPDTRELVAPAFSRFLGYVDNVAITTPKEGDEGSIELTCAPHTQEVTRSNPDTRSQDSQALRMPGDTFFKDTTTVGDWEFFWGQTTGKVQTSAPQRITTNIRAANR